MWNSSRVSWVSELDTECLPPLQAHCSDSTPWWCWLGCHSPLDVEATRSSSQWALTAQGCRGCWYTSSVRGDGDLGPKHRGVEWVSQDKAGGWKRPVELFNRAERKRIQINYLCMFAEKESCDLLLVCQAQHMSAGLAKGPRAVAGHRTNTSYCRRFTSFPGLESLLGKSRSVRSFALQRSCTPCKQMNFWKAPNQLKLAGISKLAQCKPHS